MLTTATLSTDRMYRYRLGRRWGADGLEALFVMLNPSTADESVDDPTIRRCIGFAKAWGCNALTVVNLYALRATDPEALRTHADPVGPENDATIAAAVAATDIIVCAWGAFNLSPLRVRRVWPLLNLSELRPPQCLGTTKDGHPKHPLYLPASAIRTAWKPAAPC